MIQKTPRTSALLLLLIPLLPMSLIGCKGGNNAPGAKAEAETAPPVVAKTPDANTAQTPKQETTATPAQDAVNALLREKAGVLFPKETRLKEMALRDGIATLDLNSEFAKISTMGEHTESEAQKALMKTLAAFPQIEKMSVQVEGKPFTSEATDWGTPFPVRGNAEASAGSGQ